MSDKKRPPGEKTGEHRGFMKKLEQGSRGKETTVGGLLEMRRLPMKDTLYRIEDPYSGWLNYEYMGKNRYGHIMRRPGRGKGDGNLLELFHRETRVRIIKI